MCILLLSSVSFLPILTPFALFSITKAGRYTKGPQGFDYSPDKIRSSIKNSLEQMKTDYIDGIYMHDVEFVAYVY
jgi:aryl-alcohol dehydrogenase-like predicted oxidoreductase